MERRRGSILILVMFVLSVMSLLALSMSYRAGVETRSARHAAVMVKLRALSRSAVAVAMAQLLADRNNFDHMGEAWASPSLLSSGDWLPEWQGSSFSASNDIDFQTNYRIVDEERKLHVLRASSEALAGLGLSPMQIDSFFDWMDEDGVARAEGAEDDYYVSGQPAFRTKNAAVDMIEELRLVRGLDEAGSTALGPMSGGATFQEKRLENGEFLTASGDGKININTAAEPVLATLPISDGAVSQIIGYRRFDDGTKGTLEEHAFTSEEDIRTLQGLTEAERDVLVDRVKFASQFFRISVESIHRGTGLRHQIIVLVEKADNQLKVIQWQ